MVQLVRFGTEAYVEEYSLLGLLVKDNQIW